MAALVYFLIVMTSVVYPVPATHVSLGELEFRLLEYEFEVLLKMHLREWRFLTETSSVMDVGEVLSKRMFFQNLTERSCEVSGACGAEKTFPKTVTEDRVPGDTISPTANYMKPFDTNETVSDSGVNILSDARAAAVTGASDPTTLGVANLAPSSEVKPVLHDDKLGYREDMDDSKTSHEGRHTFGDVKRRLKREGQEEVRRGAREAGTPVIYMPGGGKKTRKCAQVNGLLAGFNTFNYLTFVTGIITLILNVNNNINNNNNNNNLNNNNDLSNNNINANTNTQNANQVVLFPPGRKRRSIADWLLQTATSRAVTSPDTGSKAGEGKHAAGKVWSTTVPEVFASSPSSRRSSRHKTDVARAASEAPWCAASDVVVTILQVLDAWLEASTGMNGECGWAEYCRLLHRFTFKGTIPAVLAAPLRSFSNLVSPQWVGSTACLLQRARCSLL